jgi:hypothetical protein
VGVGVVFLRIDDGDRSYVDDLFDDGAALQDVHRTAHPHEDRANHFASTNFCNQLGGDIGRGEVWEDQDVGGALQRAERIDLLDQLG